FLMYRVDALTDAEVAAGVTRLWTEEDRGRKLRELNDLVNAHVNAVLAAPAEKISGGPQHQDRPSPFGQVLARGRAIVEWQRDRDGQWESVDIQREEPFRAIQQLRTLAQALAAIHGRRIVTDHDVELVRRVVLGSMPKSRADVIRLFANHP